MTRSSQISVNYNYEINTTCYSYQVFILYHCMEKSTTLSYCQFLINMLNGDQLLNNVYKVTQNFSKTGKELLEEQIIMIKYKDTSFPSSSSIPEPCPLPKEGKELENATKVLPFLANNELLQVFLARLALNTN